jgi:DNA polymerase (family 10)
MLDNAALAERLRLFANLAEIKGESGFRVIAFRRAADTIEALDEPVNQLVQEARLTGIPGIGPSIATALTELVETGTFSSLEELSDEVPATLLTMLDIPGVGTKTVARLYHELGITDMVQLETRAKQGEIRQLKGFGAKQEARILEGIGFLNQRTGRLSIGAALPAAEALAAALADRLKDAVSIAGSVRRMCETVGNIDIVAATDDGDAVAAALARDNYVSEIEQPEPGLIVAKQGAGVEIRLKAAKPEAFGTELVRWTGSREHVKQLLQTVGELPLAASEVSLYAALGMQTIPPELRESNDITEVARANSLPRLVALEEIRGDLHLHSDWSDGHGAILEMATAARDRGYEYLSISDHSGGLAIAPGVNADRLRQQRIEIERVNELVPEIRLFKASEVEVHLDGSLDFPDEILAELDVVVASLHSGLNRSTEEITARIVKVMQNPHVDIIAHPTGRIIDRRPGATYDWETVFRVARETGTALEINANPARLDLRDALAREAHIAGVTLVIDTDAHDVRSLDLMRFGIGAARRAGIGPDGVLNTRPLDALLSWLRR